MLKKKAAVVPGPRAPPQPATPKPDKSKAKIKAVLKKKVPLTAPPE